MGKKKYIWCITPDAGKICMINTTSGGNNSQVYNVSISHILFPRHKKHNQTPKHTLPMQISTAAANITAWIRLEQIRAEQKTTHNTSDSKLSMCIFDITPSCPTTCITGTHWCFICIMTEMSHDKTLTKLHDDVYYNYMNGNKCVCTTTVCTEHTVNRCLANNLDLNRALNKTHNIVHIIKNIYRQQTKIDTSWFISQLLWID